MRRACVDGFGDRENPFSLTVLPATPIIEFPESKDYSLMATWHLAVWIPRGGALAGVLPCCVPSEWDCCLRGGPGSLL